jgi:hypothetical protein
MSNEIKHIDVVSNTQLANDAFSINSRCIGQICKNDKHFHNKPKTISQMLLYNKFDLLLFM